jgi:hypothetical protein
LCGQRYRPVVFVVGSRNVQPRLAGKRPGVRARAGNEGSFEHKLVEVSELCLFLTETKLIRDFLHHLYGQGQRLTTKYTLPSFDRTVELGWSQNTSARLDK